jgi:hypothetical protein
MAPIGTRLVLSLAQTGARNTGVKQAGRRLGVVAHVLAMGTTPPVRDTHFLL